MVFFIEGRHNECRHHVSYGTFSIILTSENLADIQATVLVGLEEREDEA